MGTYLPSPLTLEDHQTLDQRRKDQSVIIEARIAFRLGASPRQREVAEGTHVGEAFFNVLLKALMPHHPPLADVHLEAASVTMTNNIAKVSMTLVDSLTNNNWTVEGFSTSGSIGEAAAKAANAGLTFKIMADNAKPAAPDVIARRNGTPNRHLG